MTNTVTLLRSQYEELLAAERSLAQVRRVIDALNAAEGSSHGIVVDEVRRSTGRWLEEAIAGYLDPDDATIIRSGQQGQHTVDDRGPAGPDVAAAAMAEADTLRSRIHEAATVAVNAVYGSDDKHAYMGLRIAQHVVDGTPMPWSWTGPVTCSHVFPDGTRCTLSDHSAPGLAEVHGLA